jgi:acyl-CoA synthetase (AMP-forming)/AMP-acid ligase II
MIFSGAFPEVSIPEISLTELVFARAGEHAEKPALIEGLTGRTLTYGELTEAVRSVAASLAARGFEKGDVFAIYSPNLPEYAVAFHAVASLGGVVTTINPLYTADETAHQLKDAHAKYLITVPPLVEKAREAAAHSGVGQLFVFGEAEGAVSFEELLREGAGMEAPAVEINPREDLVALPYSSGTTGLSKGVMLTHYNMVANIIQMEGTGHAYENDTLVCVLPLFHIYGMNVIMNCCLYTGATIVMLPRFEFEQVLEIIQRYRVTLGHFVPPIIVALSKSPVVEKYDLSSLKTIFSGAAPLGAQVTREVSERLSCFLKQGYGMTETSPVTHTTPNDPDRVKDGSVGLPAPNTEVKIISVETGAELGANEEGEILVRGPQVMKGYLNRPDATAETIDSEGWLHTGDIGYADDEGYFFIVDRAKELIKYKGFQVAPAELEAVLLTHPDVADAAVIPVADEEAGEVPKAFVVLKDARAGVQGETLMKFVAGRVAPYKKIRHLEFIEQIPKSPSGKILRRLLVARERAQK